MKYMENKIKVFENKRVLMGRVCRDVIRRMKKCG